MVVTTLKADRIEVVDSLRGFAVFGILVSHCYYLFFLGDATGTNLLDEEVSILVRLFVNDKFYSLFSFLFGLSFSLMLSRTNDTRGKFYRRFAWRLLLLGLIGVLHNLHWTDDILSIYAFLGFILLAVNKLNNKTIFLIAVLLLLNVPSLLINLMQQPATPEAEQSAAATFDAFYNAMKNGSYLDTIRANISAYPYKLQYYLYSGRFSFMLGFFFLGLLSGRLRLFHQFNDNKKMFWLMFRCVGAIALLFTILSSILIISSEQFSTELNSYLRPLMKGQSIFLTLTYIAGMALFFNRNSIKWLAKQFAIVGKMALTNYVLHSVLGTILLCGYGFGLINHSISITVATLASIPLFVVMILFSHFWLATFSYGPLEWVWRTATYLKIFPIKKVEFPLT